MTGAARSAACFRALHTFMALMDPHLPEFPCSREGRSPEPAPCLDLSPSSEQQKDGERPLVPVLGLP